MIFEGACLKARKCLAGFFSLTEPREADCGWYATETAPVADKDGGSGVLDGTGSEEQAQEQRAEARCGG